MNSFVLLRPNCVIRTILLLTISLSALSVAFAQQQSTDGTTPLGLAPGAPAGSYPLSDFDNVNLFNGSLNFSLPLVKVGGRGDAGYPVVLRIDHKWLVLKEPYDGQPPINYYYPQSSWWTDLGWAPVYSIGQLQVRQGGSRNYVILSGCGYVHEKTLTRLTFTAPDGTEYELRDQLTNGQPVAGSCTQFNRGTVFTTADGSAATFISETNITDYPFDNPGDIEPSGYMMLRDGTRYRIEGGKVMWIRDRNGNKVVLTYDIYKRVTSITDSLNRQVTVSYNTGAGTYDQITLKGFGGATRTIKVHFAALVNTLRSDASYLSLPQLFPELNGAGGYYNGLVVSAIELPNGEQYQFRYNSYSELARVVLPTGGAVEYDHAAGVSDSATGSGVLSGLAEKHVYRRLVERRVYPDGGSGAAYASRTTYSRPESSTTNAGYVVTDQYDATGTLLGRTQHYFNGSARASFFKQPTEYPAWTDGREYKAETFAANGTTLLRRVENTYLQRAAVSWWTGGSATEPPNDTRLTETLTTLADTNQVSKQTFGYDDSVPFNNQNNVKEYDFGSGAPGALLRETRTTYLTSSSYTDTSVHLRNLPTQVSVFDGGGVERARTTFEHDNYSTDTNHAALIDRSGISGLDSAFTTSFTTRGNVTGSTKYLLSAGSVTGSVSSYSQYDIAGNVVKAINERGNTTNLFYTDCFGAPNGEARTNSAPTELSGLSSFAFATKVTNALNQSAYAQFDYYLGQAVDSEDLNGIVASGVFDDSLDRPTQIRRAVGSALANQTSFSYDDANRILTSSSDRDANNDNLLVTKTIYDQMGRVIEKRQYEGGTNYIGTQTQYDALGRAYRTSNPFRPGLGETAVWTTAVFDVLGRATSVTTPDNAVVTTSYSGNAVTVSDATLKKHKTLTDALGRLKQVYEDPDGLNYLTSYDYDVLDNLTSVTQGTQTRTFIYNSLKQLTSAANPESGTVSYQYDSSGNLLVKTDARGVSAHFEYDSLNRATRRWYNGSSSISQVTHNLPALPSGVGATDEARFYYDSQSLPAGAPSYTRGPAVGRLVAQTYGSGANGDYFAYDVVGRQTLKIQQTGTVNYQLSAAYNLSGAIIALTYPSGHTVTSSYDQAGRLTAFSGNLGDGTTRTYSTGILYSPMGALVKEQFGTTTPIYNKLFYNVRGQLAEIRESTSYTGPTDTTWDRGAIINHYSDQCWGMCSGSSMTDNNGNLQKQEIYIPGQQMRWQQYNYDSLNRLNWAREVLDGGAEQWKQQFTYDRWGNRTINNANTYGTGINNKAFSVDTANNRLGVPVGQSGTMTYDLAGNLTNDTYTGAGNRTYDAENKITSAWGGNNQAQLYGYDGSGQRIKRTVDGVETWQVYGFGGELIAEYGASGSPTSPKKEYGYRNGQLLVTASGAPRINVASSANGGTATASETHSAPYAPSGAINGDRKLYLNNNAWSNTTATFPQWLQVDFNGNKTIDEIDVFSVQNLYSTPSEPTPTMTFNTYGLVAFQAQYWNGSSWVTVPGGNITGNNLVWKQITFSPITTSKIRIWITGSSDGYSRMTEVEAWGTSEPVSRQNVAASANGGTATASETHSAPYAPSGAINGDRKLYLDNNAWSNSTATLPQWLQVDFNGSKEIDEIDVFSVQNLYATPSEPTPTMTFNAYGLVAFQAQYWNGSSWVTVPGGNITGNNLVWKQITFSPITTSKIRIWITGTSDSYSRITEVEAWGVPSGSGGSSTAGVQWLVADQLGTPRMVLDQTGNLANIKRHDYLPFGEELFAPISGRSAAQGYAGGDGVRQQFTAYERDIETSLDYAKARYFAYVQGRFTSPDPLAASGKASVPQSWNRYGYALNNPLKFIDPSGMMWIFHYLDKEHKRIGIAWIDGNKISKDLKARGYQALNFGNDKTKDVTLSDGSVVRLSAGSGRTQLLRGAQESGGGAYVNSGLVRELGRQTAPIPKATGLFIFASVAGGYNIAMVGGPIVLADATAFAYVTVRSIGQEGDQSSAPDTLVEAGTRAPEYQAGQISQSGFLDAATKYLGPGYKEVSPGRYVSADGMRQVRFGAHETRGPGLHGHFEAYDMAGGRVIENSVVKIR